VFEQPDQGGKDPEYFNHKARKIEVKAQAGQQQHSADQIDHIVGQAPGVSALQLQQIVSQHDQRRAQHTDGIYNPCVHFAIPRMLTDDSGGYHS
tara:strand:- start:407 stop:688 length:282 start_codon:yes stop_codon:yes gene_type:complete